MQTLQYHLYKLEKIIYLLVIKNRKKSPLSYSHADFPFLPWWMLEQVVNITARSALTLVSSTCLRTSQLKLLQMKKIRNEPYLCTGWQPSLHYLQCAHVRPGQLCRPLHAALLLQQLRLSSNMDQMPATRKQSAHEQ